MEKTKRNYEIKISLGRDINGNTICTSVYTDIYPEVEILDCSSDTLIENVTINHVLFKDVINDWLRYIKGSVKLQSYNKYLASARLYIMPELGNRNLKSLDTIKINRFLEHLATSGRHDGNGLSESTLKTVLFIIKETFQYAYNFGLVNEIIHNIVLPKKKKSKDKRYVLEKKDYLKILDYIQEQPTSLNIGIGLSLCCGLRIGELCGLRKKDIDLENHIIKIHHTLQRIKVSDYDQKTRIILSTPKSKTSKRIIPMPEIIIPILKTNNYHENDFILSGSQSWVEPRQLTRYFKKLLQKLEIRDTNFHTLRHTFASLCIASGMDDRTLSEILGHSSVNITMDRYVHPNLKMKHEMINKVDFIKR